MAGFALVFPGQGSQVVGMGRDLTESSAAARLVFDEADDVLGYPLSRLCFSGPADQLQSTEHAQPALLATSIAALAALRECVGSLAPVAVAGHSLGEYTALVAAGALDFATALRLVAERGRLMRAAGDAAPGAMLAVLGLPDEKIAAVRADAARFGAIAVANENAPGQTVLSGSREAIAAATRLAKEAGARRAIPLAVSGAFHSPLMRSAADALAPALAAADLRDPRWPVVANTSARILLTAAAVRAELGQQLTGPVLWSAGIRAMAGLGARAFVELGPGSVLAGLVKRTIDGAIAVSAGDSRGVSDAADLVSESGHQASE